MVTLSKGLELFLLVASALGLIYKLSQVETAIYRSIDTLKDNTTSQINQLTNRQDLQAKDIEHTNYVIHQLNGKIDHKFDRLHQGQREIQSYLQSKFEFMPRQFFGNTDSKQ